MLLSIEQAEFLTCQHIDLSQKWGAVNKERAIRCGTNGMPDYGANAGVSGRDYGPISTMLDIVGLTVHMNGHIGVYIGGGYVIEAANTSVGVIQPQLAGRGWTEWCKIPYINYLERTPWKRKAVSNAIKGRLISDDDQHTMGLDDAWVTCVSVISIAVGVAAYPLVNILARRVGKKPMLLGACITYTVLYCAIFNYKLVIAAIGGPTFAILIGLVIAFPIAITNIIPASVFADLAQYDTIKTGQNRAGMFLAARNFANKLCQAVAAACSLLLGTGDRAATSEGVQKTALVAMVFVALALAFKDTPANLCCITVYMFN